MKRGWKIFLAVCGSLAVLGLVLCIVGILMGAQLQEIGGILRNNGIKHHEEHHEEREIVKRQDSDSGMQFQDIKCMEIEVAGVEVEFLPSEDEYYYVETSALDDAYNFQCYQKEDTLEIHTTSKIDLISGFDEDGLIQVFIPRAQLEELDISNGAGAVTVNGVNTRELTIDVGAGEGILFDITAQNVEFHCGAGQITASGEITGEVEIECGMGEVVLDIVGSEEDYSYEVECGMGEVVIGSQHFSGVGVEHHGGSHMNRHISAECGMGSVCVSFR